MQTTADDKARLLSALHSTEPVDGLTHKFYRYPARMLPELVSEIICQFTRPGDTVLDPFMGGGTTIVEAIAHGRRVIGIDVNPIATFVTQVKTTPLSPSDVDALRQWLRSLDFSARSRDTNPELYEAQIINLPPWARTTFAGPLAQAQQLPYPRQKRFAVCCILRLGQWAIETKGAFPGQNQLKEKSREYFEEMLNGLDHFVAAAQTHGIAKSQITTCRTLLTRSSARAHEEQRLSHLIGKASLVITSPPYPNIHVLYHRWQVAGRRETPAPYWFIGSKDGQNAAHYTLGGRSQKGVAAYFRSITEVFKSVRQMAESHALVVQLVSFSDVPRHLPRFLEAMELAGYEEVFPLSEESSPSWRTIPHRRWYNDAGTARIARRELLLFHQPRGLKSK